MATRATAGLGAKVAKLKAELADTEKNVKSLKAKLEVELADAEKKVKSLKAKLEVAEMELAPPPKAKVAQVVKAPAEMSFSLRWDEGRDIAETKFYTVEKPYLRTSSSITVRVFLSKLCCSHCCAEYPFFPRCSTSRSSSSISMSSRTPRRFAFDAKVRT